MADINWSSVGDWLKNNAGTGAALVGSLLTGNIPTAVAAGVALVSSATGHAEPSAALEAFQSDPTTVLKLKELYYENENNLREHVRKMTQLELEDRQAEHKTTQATIINSDNSEDPVVRRTRPFQSWCSLFAAFAYVFVAKTPDVIILGMLLALPFAYAGLRQAGKWTDSKNTMKAIVGAGK